MIKYFFNKKIFALVVIILLVNLKLTAQKPTNLNESGTFVSNRDDGRYINSLAVTWNLMKENPPDLAFKTSFTHNEFNEWKIEVRKRFGEQLQFPFPEMSNEIKNQPSPKLIYELPRDGYKVQKWEAYPLPKAVITFLVLIPDKVTGKNTTPAVLCIPGTNGTKEELAGEPEFNPSRVHGLRSETEKMALHYVQKGFVAVAVDEPGVGETSDYNNVLEKTDSPNSHDFKFYYYHNTAKNLLEMGWNYLGFSVFLDQAVIKWMKTQPFINPSRIIISGMSLGTEPALALTILDPSIFALVYNDFLCRTRERQLVLTEPDAKGDRPTPNHGISHSIPRFFSTFDLPDICAAVAPRPLLITEGGLSRDLDLVKKAYEIAGNEGNFQYYYYPKYSDPQYRSNLKELPYGIGRNTYLDLVNVNPGNHFFKMNLVAPWLNRVLKK